MKNKNFNHFGGIQSLFFCAGIYVAALFFSIFVCSSIFYTINAKPGSSTVKVAKEAQVLAVK